MSNPFIAYDDGFAWPDLYTECDEMIEACVLTCLLAELRSLVRRGEATTKTETVMKMPLTAKDLMKVIRSSRLLLMAEDNEGCSMELATGIQSIHYCHHLLRTTDERLMKDTTKNDRKQQQNNPSPFVTGLNPEPRITDTTYLTFDDEFTKQGLTYSIGVNHKRRRITMCFKGSVVSNVDWATDFDTYMKEVKNPMKMHSSQQPTMKIHSKLHDLLYAETWPGVQSLGSITTHSGEASTEFMTILQDKVRPATDNYPGYKVRVHFV